MFRSDKKVWKYIFTFDGSTHVLFLKIHFCFVGNTYLLLLLMEGLHLLLLSSGPVDCSDQKGIDDPFSELIDIERHLFQFSAMMMIPSKTPTQINLYRFCTAVRWKNNLMKNGTSHIFSSESNFIGYQGQVGIIGTLNLCQLILLLRNFKLQDL